MPERKCTGIKLRHRGNRTQRASITPWPLKPQSIIFTILPDRQRSTRSRFIHGHREGLRVRQLRVGRQRRDGPRQKREQPRRPSSARRKVGSETEGHRSVRREGQEVQAGKEQEEADLGQQEGRQDLEEEAEGDDRVGLPRPKGRRVR